MLYETTAQALSAMDELEKTLAAYYHALNMMGFDAATRAPAASAAGRGQTMGLLTQVCYDLVTASKTDEMLKVLEQDPAGLTPEQTRRAALLRKSYRDIRCIPADEYIAYQILVNDAQAVWEVAKRENDFSVFAPYLEKIVDYTRKFAAYRHPEMDPYDACLQDFEEGLTTQVLDGFFAQLRETIVPLLEKIQKAPQIDNSFLYQYYPVDKQRELSYYLMEQLGLPKDRCILDESEHPFTDGLGTGDVRITTHYYENALAFSMYSVIHEGGHAIYELGVNPDYDRTGLFGGVSMAIHESQSRFFENLIGRSKPFIHHIFPKVKELFPEQLANVTGEQFYRAINKVSPSLIRTEADELTYCLHVMVRYELEKQLIGGTLAVSDVPAAWNAMYKDYLGIDVPSDREGCLQDSHWAGGMIGYFPSYALGSAYGPQLLRAMVAEVGDVYGDVAEGDLTKVKSWLGAHIHQYGQLYTPKQLLEKACGPFDPKFYTDYLVEKFTGLYNL